MFNILWMFFYHKLYGAMSKFLKILTSVYLLHLGRCKSKNMFVFLVFPCRFFFLYSLSQNLISIFAHRTF